MKRRLAISLLTLFLFLAGGIAFAVFHMKSSAAELGNIVMLHEVDGLRQSLVISIQATQADLYTVNTPLGPEVDAISRHMMTLEHNALSCSGCHHTPETTARLAHLQPLLHRYKQALSAYITTAASSESLKELKLEAARRGNDLLMTVERMTSETRERLRLLTETATRHMNRSRDIVIATVGLSLVLSIVILMHLVHSVTSPIGKLVAATRRISSEGPGVTVNYPHGDEFGELADHLNTMSLALKQGYEDLRREVSEREETASALRRSEEFLNTIFQSIRDPFCIVDRRYRIIRVNREYAAMRGKSASDLEGKVCYRANYARISVCPNCVIERTFRSGDPQAKVRLDERAGEPNRWREIYTYPITDRDGGHVSFVIQYSRDVTERKHTEEQLRRSEERYALASRGANDGLWDWDLKADTIYYSPRWKAILGYRDEIGDRPADWFERVHPEDRGLLHAKVEAHIEGRTSHFKHEHRLMHRDGAYRWVLCRGLAVRNGDREPHRMAGSMTDVTERKLAEQKLMHDALHDTLTGLPNRLLFMSRLDHSVKSASRRKTSFAVLFLDMDNFKVINDSLGHSAGDRFLVTAGERLLSCLRSGDTAARLGGDEFAVLLEDLEGPEQALRLTERIQQALSQPCRIAGQEVYPTASIGIAVGASGGDEPENLLRNADIAMYQAKANGKACYVVFQDAMYMATLRNLQMGSELRRALDNGEFVLHYQPILALETERVVGFEALMRWQHPEHGLLHPKDFIPLAEGNGFITEMGRWSLVESTRQMANWLDLYPVNPRPRLHVNISSVHFSSSDLVADVIVALEASGLDPTRLCLEITERIIKENSDAAAEVLARLREMGVEVHIDDFGTGYSSLSHLSSFPINALKIDRSFVGRITEKTENVEIVKAIVSLAQALNLRIVAEGIEHQEQAEIFRMLGCQFGQGFLFSRPVDPDAASAWLEREHDGVSA